MATKKNKQTAEVKMTAETAADPLTANVATSPTAEPTDAVDPMPATVATSSISDPEEIAYDVQPLNQIVVCAFSGTEALMESIWTKFCSVRPLILSVLPDTDIRTILELCIADSRIDDSFVLVPANTFPCSAVEPEELYLPVVYVDRQNKEHYAHRLPMAFSKDDLAEYLPCTEDEGESLVKGYVSKYRTRPVRVGYTFGNFVTPVLRANPCENIVLEGFLRRKFIAASPEGFSAIETMIRDHLLK